MTRPSTESPNPQSSGKNLGRFSRVDGVDVSNLGFDVGRCVSAPPWRAGAVILTIAPGKPRHRVANRRDRKSTRLNFSHVAISYAVFCLKKKKLKNTILSIS